MSDFEDSNNESKSSIFDESMDKLSVSRESQKDEKTEDSDDESDHLHSSVTRAKSQDKNNYTVAKSTEVQCNEVKDNNLCKIQEIENQCSDIETCSENEMEVALELFRKWQMPEEILKIVQGSYIILKSLKLPELKFSSFF